MCVCDLWNDVDGMPEREWHQAGVGVTFYALLVDDSHSSSNYNRGVSMSIHSRMAVCVFFILAKPSLFPSPSLSDDAKSCSVPGVMFVYVLAHTHTPI